MASLYVCEQVRLDLEGLCAAGRFRWENQDQGALKVPNPISLGLRWCLGDGVGGGLYFNVVLRSCRSQDISVGWPRSSWMDRMETADF